MMFEMEVSHMYNEAQLNNESLCLCLSFLYLFCPCLSVCLSSSHYIEIPSITFGEKLREQVEERLVFFETGATPRKNIHVMQEAIGELEKKKMFLAL